MNSTKDVEPDYTLHKLVFNNDVAMVKKHLEESPKNWQVVPPQKDMHGNNPLHLAVMLGHHDIVDVLVDHGHPVSNKNNQGWTPLQEAVSYGNRDTILSLLRSNMKKNKSVKKEPKAQQVLKSFGKTFKFKMTWDFVSWLPLVSNVLPSDVCQVYVKENFIRMDSTLEDFSNLKWVRGDLSLIADFNCKPKPSVHLLDNNKKTYYRIDEPTKEESEATVHENCDILMSQDIVDAKLNTAEVDIRSQNSGWFFRKEKTEKVGQFNSTVYKVSNLTFTQKKRREHLTDRDIQRNRIIKDSLKGPGSFDYDSLAEDDEIENRKSLLPPAKCRYTWDKYAALGKNHSLARTRKEKQISKTFEANVSMSQEFPVKVDQLLTILEMLGPKAKFYKRIREFVELRLPPGFPVKINIPIVPTVKATVSFPEFEFTDDLPASLFAVPSDYKKIKAWRKNNS